MMEEYCWTEKVAYVMNWPVFGDSENPASDTDIESSGNKSVLVWKSVLRPDVQHHG